MNTYWLNFVDYMSCSGSLVPNQCRGSAALINLGGGREQSGAVLDFGADGGGGGGGEVCPAKNRETWRLTNLMPYLAEVTNTTMLHVRGDRN